MGIANRAEQYGVVLGSEALTPDSATAVALTVPEDAYSALITAGTNPIRWRADGTDPTATVGHFVATNASVEIFGRDVKRVKIISTAATSACFVSYFGE